ncbi:MAG: type II toxin-antitoxin system RelE/ParE family toxin [Chlorobiaceae bacterium]|nr:type II toxin-antitoxin system RelE/ParE family toxin [Chlorobiaceae bacterium]
MARSVFILDSAKDDYREIRKYVKHKFGEKVWQDSDQKYKEMLKNIGEFPFAGLIPDEAIQLGLQGIRERLVGQTRVIYEVASQSLYVHMFVSTRRDFTTMLTNRLLKNE